MRVLLNIFDYLFMQCIRARSGDCEYKYLVCYTCWHSFSLPLYQVHSRMKYELVVSGLVQ